MLRSGKVFGQRLLGSSQHIQWVITADHNELPATFHEVKTAAGDFRNEGFATNLAFHVAHGPADNPTGSRGFRLKDAIAPAGVAVPELVLRAVNNFHAAITADEGKCWVKVRTLRREQSAKHDFNMLVCAIKGIGVP